MSDYVYRRRMEGDTCHQCEEGTIHSGSCDECSFMF
jgi:hypothetical protein